jgi:hypothetical protein
MSNSTTASIKKVIDDMNALLERLDIINFSEENPESAVLSEIMIVLDDARDDISDIKIDMYSNNYFKKNKNK